MRPLAALVASLVLLVPSAVGRRQLEPGSYRIRLSATLTETSGMNRTYALWNRPAYRNQIGTAFVDCEPIATGWLDCVETFRLRRGEIIARGVVPAASLFRVLAVIGGTGFYSTVGGEATIQPSGPSPVLLILIDLAAF
jgi:hypothetical protein